MAGIHAEGNARTGGVAVHAPEDERLCCTSSQCRPRPDKKSADRRAQCSLPVLQSLPGLHIRRTSPSRWERRVGVYRNVQRPRPPCRDEVPGCRLCDIRGSSSRSRRWGQRLLRSRSILPDDRCRGLLEFQAIYGTKADSDRRALIVLWYLVRQGSSPPPPFNDSGMIL